MISLSDLLSQNQPHFQTHQALLLIGLQNDFIQPDGKLPVNTRNGFLDRLHLLIPKFRQLSANVIWIQTIYEADRMANDPTTGEGDAVVVGGLVDGVESSTDDDDDLPKDNIPPTQSRSSKHKQRALDLLKRVSARRRTIPREEAQAIAEEDEELFLLRASKNGAACLPNTPGADFADSVKPRIASSDTIVQTTNYSAFQGTSLLLNLRAKLVTELYICGCITNVSILATVIDAARHGIKINLVGDCLGFRRQPRHDLALKRMVEFFDVEVVTSTEILNREPEEETQEQPKSQNGSKDATDELEKLVNRLQLGDGRPHTRQNSSSNSPYQTAESPAIVINGRQRTLSDASIAESRTTTDTKMSDEQFAEKLTQGAKIPRSADNKTPTAKQNLVKSKIRMRSRTDKSKKEEDKRSKADSRKKEKGEASSRHTAAETATDLPTKAPRASEPLIETPRPTSITKAESSDKLRESPPRREQSLKSSFSQPSLSSANFENKDNPSPSRVRLALPRSPKSDSSKPESHTVLSAQPPKSPTKTPTKPPKKATAEATVTPSPPANSTPIGKKLQSLATFPVLGPGDRIAEGDSRIIYDFFGSEFRHPTDTSKPLKDLIFQQLYNEVRWQKMFHQQGEVPRLVCCQGEFGADGSMPVYRHPTDQALPLLHFSPKVKVIRKQAEKLVGHPLNHVLIQLYRSGQDYISEHSDKTLDIAKGSSIVNVSFGAQRTMRLRKKKAAKVNDSQEPEVRNTQRVAMPHNSMFVLGLKSNEKWLHGINADKRLQSERSEAEQAYSGIRISLTFRNIGTFLDAENNMIWGQGATSKDHRDAQDVINADEDENEKVIRAFSRENHHSEFDWDEWYGDGFDVLHFLSPPEDVPILFASSNRVETQMIQVFLWENKLNHVLLEVPTLEKQYELGRQVCYRDNDVSHTEVVKAVPILLYLDHYHPIDHSDRGRSCSSQSYEIFVVVSAMLKHYLDRQVPTSHNNFTNLIDSLEERHALGPGPFIAGRRFSIGDCSVWPALDEIINNWEGWTEARFPSLTEYYRMLWKKKKSVAKLRKELPAIRKTAEVKKEKEQKNEEKED